MSDTPSATDDQETKPTIGLDDVKAIREFFNHFKIPVREQLTAALAAFEKEQTFKNQEYLKKVVAHEMITSKHEAFLDPMFKNVYKVSEEVTYSTQFDKDLEEVLVTKNEG